MIVNATRDHQRRARIERHIVHLVPPPDVIPEVDQMILYLREFLIASFTHWHSAVPPITLGRRRLPQRREEWLARAGCHRWLRDQNR